MKDILEFDLAQNHYLLITGSWCLGFFEEYDILELLEKVRNGLAKGGVAVFKESITEGVTSEEGGEFYLLHSKAKYETLFEMAEFEYQEED